MNVHNPYIRKWDPNLLPLLYGNDPGPIGFFASTAGDEVDSFRVLPRSGTANESVLQPHRLFFGPWTRCDEPLIFPRDCSHWDCTATTNPAVAIQPDAARLTCSTNRVPSQTVQIKNRCCKSAPPGWFGLNGFWTTRFSIFEGPPNIHLEDPYLWYEDGKFRLLIKDDFKNRRCPGISGMWGAGLYAESADCIHWEFAENPARFTPATLPGPMADRPDQANCERPYFLLDENNHPTHLFLATGEGHHAPTGFSRTWNMVIPLR